MELEITWKRAIRIWWAWLWRCLIVFGIGIIIILVMGFAIGFVIGFILSKLGFETERIVQICTILGDIFGGIIALITYIIPLKMILGKDFGEFRLVLLTKDTPTITSR